MSSFWKNILLILGTTVGAGIFSLPQILHKVGLVWFIVFLFLFAYVMYRVNWYYFQVIKKVKGDHQLSGYVDKVINRRIGAVAVILHLLSTYGALIAFILIGGEFLGKTLAVSPQIGSCIFFAVSIGVMLLSGKKAESMDVLFSLLKGGMFMIIVWLFLANAREWEAIPAASFVIPAETIGAFIFAFTGFSIIPELHKEKDEGKSIATAQIIILLIYFLFTIAAIPFIRGEDYIFASPIMEKIFSLTGFISVFTAYLLAHMVGKDILTEDIKLNSRLAFILMAFVPFFFVIFQIGSFLTILSITGGVFLAGTGLLICWMYLKLFPKSAGWELRVIQLLLVVTIIYEVLSNFK